MVIRLLENLTTFNITNLGPRLQPVYIEQRILSLPDIIGLVSLYLFIIFLYYRIENGSVDPVIKHICDTYNIKPVNFIRIIHFGYIFLIGLIVLIRIVIVKLG